MKVIVCFVGFRARCGGLLGFVEKVWSHDVGMPCSWGPSLPMVLVKFMKEDKF